MKARKDTLLIGLLWVALLLTLAEKMSTQASQITGKIEMASLLLASVAAVFRGRSLPRTLILPFLCWVSAPVLGMLNSRRDPFAIGQFILDLKFPLLLFVAYRLSEERTRKAFEYLIAMVAVLGAFLVVAEHAAPGAYARFFPGSVVGTTVSGLGWRRCSGVCFHPAPSGPLSGCLIIGLLALPPTIVNRILLLCGVVNLLGSGQRAEVLAVIATVIPLKMLWARKNRLLTPAYLALAVMAAVPVGLYAQSVLEAVEERFHLDPNAPIYAQAPRLVLLRGAVELATSHFPLGAGLGTYAGSMSRTNPQNMYDVTRVEGLWWFERGAYLTDTYWANPLGEIGWLGTCLILLGHGLLLATLLRSRGAPWVEAPDALRATALTVFGLLVSLNGPVYTGSLLTMSLIAIPVAMLVRAEVAATQPDPGRRLAGAKALPAPLWAGEASGLRPRA